MQALEYQKLFTAETSLWWFRALHKFVLRLLPRPATGARILDIGCGTGGLLEKFQQSDHRAVGLDFSWHGLSLAKNRGIPLVRGSANFLPFASAFDRITCIDVLEVSTIDPRALVHSAIRALKPGEFGLFVMAAHQWLMSDHDKAVDSVRRFSLRQLRHLFAGEDVTIVRGTYLFMTTFPLLALRKLINRSRTTEVPKSDVEATAPVLDTVLFALCSIEAALLPFLNLPIGSSVAVLVRKNAGNVDTRTA